MAQKLYNTVAPTYSSRHDKQHRVQKIGLGPNNTWHSKQFFTWKNAMFSKLLGFARDNPTHMSTLSKQIEEEKAWALEDHHHHCQTNKALYKGKFKSNAIGKRTERVWNFRCWFFCCRMPALPSYFFAFHQFDLLVIWDHQESRGSLRVCLHVLFFVWFSFQVPITPQWTASSLDSRILHFEYLDEFRVINIFRLDTIRIHSVFEMLQANSRVFSESPC